MRKYCTVLAAVTAFLLLAAGCGAGGAAGKGAGADDGRDKLKIVTSFYPVYIATINVAKDVPGISVANLTEPQTGCLHDYSLKPGDLKILEDADVFVVNGAGMESFLDDVAKNLEDLKIIEASRGIELLKGTDGEDNPHVWVSVTNMIEYVGNIAEQLAGFDPENAELYERNAGEYGKRLEVLKKDMHAALGSLKKRDIVTFHEAFPYFAKEFGLNVVAVVEDEAGTEPAPRKLAGIIDIIGRSGVEAVFAEPRYSSGAVDIIARETGAKVHVLDPVVTGEATPDAYDDYEEAMRRNMEVLKEALG